MFGKQNVPIETILKIGILYLIRFAGLLSSVEIKQKLIRYSYTEQTGLHICKPIQSKYKIIRHDFSGEISEIAQVSEYTQEEEIHIVSAPDVRYKKSPDYWKNKYLELLEKYNNLLADTLAMQKKKKGEIVDRSGECPKNKTRVISFTGFIIQKNRNSIASQVLNNYFLSSQCIHPLQDPTH